MKNLLLLLISCLLVTCQKDGDSLPIFEPGPMDTGFCEAWRGFNKWESTAFALFHPNNNEYIALYFVTFSELGENREYLILSEIPTEPGKYYLKGRTGDINDGFVGVSFAILESDGDVLGPRYRLKEGFEDGYVLITKVDTVSRIVEGEFNEIRLYNSSGHENYPSEITFSRGKFSMSIIQ